jgi:hypothetical protein
VITDGVPWALLIILVVLVAWNIDRIWWWAEGLAGLVAWWASVATKVSRRIVRRGGRESNG